MPFVHAPYLQTFSQQPPTDVVLRIAGGVETGAEQCAAELKQRAEGLPIEWLGEMHGLAEFHKACDVFVMISDPAGCPNASLEALAAGLAVIATDIGGASEQVIDCLTGRLVPARDIGALARAMVELAHDQPLRDILARNARDHVQQNFSLGRMTAAYRDLLDL